MGPKVQPKTLKGKQPAVPEKNLKELTHVEKEFFEFTLSDIKKKINKIDSREEDLKKKTIEIEEQIEEFKKEKGGVITEHEQLLATREEEMVQKRNEINQLSEEIKIRTKKYLTIMQEWEKKNAKTVEKFTKLIEEQEQEIQDLENYKQNKDGYFQQLDDLEIQMEEAEIRHGILIENNKKQEQAIERVKKEIHSRILRFSSEFRKMSQNKLGKPCHRMILESKAIQNTLMQMEEEILEYQERYKNSKNSMIECKNQRDKKQQEKDQMIARTVIQLYVIKALMSERVKLLEKLKAYDPVVAENQNSKKKLQNVSLEIENRSSQIEETTKNIEDKIEETTTMKEASGCLKKKTRSLQMLVRNALKIAREAMAMRLIPIGKLEEDKHLPTEAKIRLFKKRRDSVFRKKGKVLQNLLDVLSKAQLTEKDKKLLKDSSDSLRVEDINFSSIFGKMTTVELEKAEGDKEVDEEKKRKGPMFFTSLTSLPRSMSAIIIPEKSKSEYESFEGELGEYGEYEEEMIRIQVGETELFGDFDLDESENSEAEEEMTKDLMQTKSE